MSDWDQGNPADSDLLSQYPQNERDARDAVRANFAINHHSSDDSDVGKHEVIEILANATPTAVSGQGNFYTKDVGSGQIELFYQDADGNEVQLTVSGAPGGFESGTSCLFYQASAPTGWTQDTSVNDRVLMVVDGAGGGTGGSWTISGIGQGSLSVDGHQLSISEIPSHNHGGGNHDHAQRGSNATGGGSNLIVRDEDMASGVPVESANDTANSGTIINSNGGDGSHDHPLSGSPNHDGTWRPAHADVIVATKD